MAISVKRYDPFTTILPVVLQLPYIMATVLNLSFTILSIGRGLFMCPLAHAAFIHFQKKVVFVMAGGFYNKRCIYVPLSFISVLLKDKILALEALDDFIGNEVGKIVCGYNSNYWAI